MSDHVPTLEPIFPSSSHFADCTSLDGYGRLTYNDADSTFSADLEYVSSKANFELKAYNPLGQTILNLTSLDGKIRLKPGSPTQFVAFERDQNDFIVIDDEWIGIKYSEIPCILSHYWPKSWLHQTNPAMIHSESTGFEIENHNRTISIQDTRYSKAKGTSCTTISWKKYLFFTAAVEICHNQKAQNTRILIEDSTINWVSE